MRGAAPGCGTRSCRACAARWGSVRGLAAAFSMGDLGVIALFSTPGQGTLPLEMYRLMGSYRTDDAQGAAVLLMALTLALFWGFEQGGASMLSLDDLSLTQDGFTLSLFGRDRPRGARGVAWGRLAAGKSTAPTGPLIAGFDRPDRGGRILWEGGDISRGRRWRRGPVSILFQDGQHCFRIFRWFDNVAPWGLSQICACRRRTASGRREPRSSGVGPIMRANARRRCRAGNRRGWRWRGCCCVTGRLRCWTNPLPRSIRGSRPRCWRRSADLCAARGLTLLMACHDLRDAERLCDRLWLLEEGAKVLDVALTGLRDDPPGALRPWL